ncbi:hypothetical protein ACQP2U_42760 (plasmid) [Nocardia sp. CA-084685]|uniref:hypothetical protein n=1 Tax=Nocardia sp. CA-084685 TaxID=3239970 RepID=UPI003D96A947
MHPIPAVDFDDADKQQPHRPRPPILPTVIELHAAMAGRVPEQHPARTVLLGARMLTTVTKWVNPDSVVVGGENYDDTREYDHDSAGSEVLAEIGIADICDPIRITIIDRINQASGGWYNYRIGHAIDAIARAHWEWRRAWRPDTRAVHDPRIQQWITRARRQVVATQRDYRMLVNGRTWIEGPEPEPRDR